MIKRTEVKRISVRFFFISIRGIENSPKMEKRIYYTKQKEDEQNEKEFC